MLSAHDWPSFKKESIVVLFFVVVARSLLFRTCFLPCKRLLPIYNLLDWLSQESLFMLQVSLSAMCLSMVLQKAGANQACIMCNTGMDQFQCLYKIYDWLNSSLSQILQKWGLCFTWLYLFQSVSKAVVVSRLSLSQYKLINALCCLLKCLGGLYSVCVGCVSVSCR